MRPTVDRLTLFANFGGSISRDETLWLRNLIFGLAGAVDSLETERARRAERMERTAFGLFLLSVVLLALAS